MTHLPHALTQRLFYLCHDLGVDLAAAVSRKMDANALKYPVEKARGRSNKYTRL